MRRGHQRGFEVVEGVVEGVRFQSAESGFTVLVATIGRAEESLVGELAVPVEKGAKFKAHGRWGFDRKHGRQFRFEALEIMAPTTTDEIVARLKTYPGIGGATAERIVEQFGDQTWAIMDADIGDLVHIPGIGPKAIAKIRAHHKKQSGPIAKIKNMLIAVGGRPGLAKSIHEHYGERSLAMLSNHPYKVAARVERFGFKLAEAFARSTGLDPEIDERIDAGVLQAIRLQRGHGHCCIPPDELTNVASGLLRVRSQRVDESVERLLDEYRMLRYRHEMVFLAGMDHLESRVASSIASIVRPVRGVWDVGEVPEHLSPGQREAVVEVARSGVTVLTGGPGTGKSTVVGAVIDMAERAGCEVLLCAPTGRAAKRLAEATGRQASTVHRLLRPIPGSRDFHHDQANPLPAGLVVVDEVSMVDIELADALFGALTHEHRVLLVGDADQLPSVGPGNLLQDLIAAAEQGFNVALVRLEQVFRQADGSSIVTNAHRMLAGHAPISDDPSLGNAGQFYILKARDPEQAHAKIVHLAMARIPCAYGFDPKTEVQILSPMHGGPAGTEAFNAKLQHCHSKGLADNEAFWGARGRRFRVGDRVMQMRNDYERSIFNGDIGTVLEFDDTFMIVDFDGAKKKYKRFDLATLQLAYAMTIHKSQGGEFPAVIIPVFGSRMMNRNLLYTAVTRARSLCMLVGDPRAIQRAVQACAMKRWTCLSQRLVGSGN